MAITLAELQQYWWLVAAMALLIGFCIGWGRCDRMWEKRRERNGWKWPPHIPPWTIAARREIDE